jgi:thioredoxin-related protein
LNEEEALAEINNMETVQLNMWSDTPVITPDGRETTAREWAKELGLFYSPTIIFFDYNGKEIIRIDSVVQYYRLWGVLDYVNKKAYLTGTDYQGWRLKQRETSENVQ